MKNSRHALALVALASLCSACNDMTVGMIPMSIWIMLFMAVLFGMIMSVQNVVTTLVFLSVRPQNDDLITRETHLERMNGAESIPLEGEED